MPDDTLLPAGEAVPTFPAEDRHSRATGRLIALGEVIVASGFPTQFALSVLLIAAGFRPFDEFGSLSLSYVVSVWILDTAALLGFMAWRVRASHESIRALFIGDRPIRREVMIGVVSVPVLLAAVVLLLGGIRLVMPALHNVPANPFEALIRTAADAWILGTMAVVSGGLKEEAQRAFVLHRFGQHLGGARIGLVLFSLVFGAGHVIQGWDVGLVTMLLGFLWGVLYLQRRSVTASVVSHSGFNVIQILQFTLFGSS